MAPVYGFCDANCKQPVYTVQETITILEQLIQGGSMAEINPALLPVVAAIREQHNNKDINFWLGTEAELNAINPAVTTKLLMPRVDGENNLYLCSDDSTLDTWKNEILAAARELVTGYATAENLQAMGVHEYTQNSAGALTGSGANGKFKAAISGTYSTIKINGTVYPVNSAGESEIELVAGAWYTFVFDGIAVNFRRGGGLSNSKLALATATENDVLTGKTFYSGSKELKTGTLVKGVFGEIPKANFKANTPYRVELGFTPSVIAIWNDMTDSSKLFLQLWIDGEKREYFGNSYKIVDNAGTGSYKLYPVENGFEFSFKTITYVSEVRYTAY